MFIRPISNQDNNKDEIINQLVSLFNDEIITRTDDRYKGFCSTLCRGILEDSIKIWGIGGEKQELDNFTDHSINHSIRIINYFLKFSKAYEISDKELVTIIIAALIHDFGMQLNEIIKYFPDVGVPTIVKESFEEYFKNQNKKKLKYSASFIRKMHGEIGLNLVEFLLINKIQAFSFCNLQNSSEELEIFNYAIQIAYAHCSEIQKNIIFNRDLFENRLESDGRYFRPRLLAGLLMICDLLDCDKRRLKSPENVLTRRVPKASKLHWFSCAYIRKVNIKKEENVLQFCISLEWNFPKIECKQLIFDLLFNFRLREIRKYISEIVLLIEDKYVIKHFFQIDLNGGTEDNTLYWNDVLYELLKNSETCIKKKQLKKRLSKPNKTSQKMMSPFSSRPHFPFSDFSRSKEPTDIICDLEKWVENNTIKDHFELNTGDHTNVYFHCRTLVSDSLMITKISKEILGIVRKNRQEINCVLGIGTSSIPITVSLAHLLKCHSTFTFYSEEIDNEFFNSMGPNKSNTNQLIEMDNAIESDKSQFHDVNNSGYEYFEVLPSIPPSSNLLIVDDIIASGNVINKIINNLKINLGNIYCYSIFRLGDRDIVFENEYSSSSLLWIPEVRYWDKNKCEPCNIGHEPIIERKMY